MAQEEPREAKESANNWSNSFRQMLPPKDPDDERNAFLRFALAQRRRRSRAVLPATVPHVQPLCRRRRRWRVEIMSMSEGEHGGYKEIIAKISGDGVRPTEI